MKNQKGKLLKKQDVDAFINSGEAIYDQFQSKKDNSEVYRFSDGRILYRRLDGKGVVWQSAADIETVLENGKNEVQVLNLTDWILDADSLHTLEKKNLFILRNKIGKELDYSKESMLLISKLKFNNLEEEKEVFYSIIFYSCEYFSRILKGRVSVERIDEERHFRPIVLDSAGRVFIPYQEFIESFAENTGVSIDQSIEIELNKYKLA